jgi:hypothetical protein
MVDARTHQEKRLVSRASYGGDSLLSLSDREVAQEFLFSSSAGAPLFFTTIDMR